MNAMHAAGRVAMVTLAVSVSFLAAVSTVNNIDTRAGDVNVANNDVELARINYMIRIDPKDWQRDQPISGKAVYA